MRLSVVSAAACRALTLLGFAFGAAEFAAGEGTVSPTGVAVLQEEPLTPLPAEEADPFVVSGDDEECSSCNGGGYAYNRCGCDAPLFPYLTGPGNCDNWCVGPHWNVEADGLILQRTGADWGAIESAVGLAPDLIDQFDYGPGARVFVTGYNDSDFGLQVGYEGINDYHATALFPDGGDLRSFDYQSNLNSIEFNALRRTTAPTKLFAGFRYVEIDEDFIDAFTVAKSVPPPANPPGIASFVDTSEAFLLENRLIGFQAGAFRDAWALNKWLTIEPYGNAGVYYNNFKRENLQRTTTTIITGDDPTTPTVIEGSTVVTENQFGVTRNFSDIAFLGEVGVTAVLRVNRCVALRGGYQALAVDGVGEGLDAFFNPGLDGSTVVYHGFRFGLEYQR